MRTNPWLAYKKVYRRAVRMGLLDLLRDPSLIVSQPTLATILLVYVVTQWLSVFGRSNSVVRIVGS